MPYDPAKPVEGTLCDAAEMRSQLQGLQDEIAAAGVTGAQIDNTNTAAPGNPATAFVTLTSGVLHFDFSIPAGQNGEVTQSQLSNDLVNCQNAAVKTVLLLTPANGNSAGTLSIAANTSYGPAEMQAVISKVVERINALRR